MGIEQVKMPQYSLYLLIFSHFKKINAPRFCKILIIFESSVKIYFNN